MIQMTLLVLLSSATIASASFGPAVRVDHQYLLNHRLCNTAMAIGPGAPSSQPIYVAFQDDSTIFAVRTDIMFQKSTDAGRTWLPSDLLIRRGAPRGECPDITTDSDGNVYIVYENVYRDTAGAYDHQVLCTRSSDGGATWSEARIDDASVRQVGMISIAADSAGNLFCAWTDWRTGYSHIWSSVSTDRGATWSRNVKVDDDTTDFDCAHADVSVQPGTNHYLVAATTPRSFGSYVRNCAFLYRSTDCGQTFEPGVQLDTFNQLADNPHVVADRDHIICDYFGSGWANDDTIIAESRTFYMQADSWGSPVRITEFDSLHKLYISGTLALSGDGRVHTALTVQDTADSRYNVYYASSSDHGVSWSDLDLVSDDTTVNSWYPDIVVDMEGHAYVVWQLGDGDGRIWFATNNPLAIAEEPSQPGWETSARVVSRYDDIQLEYQLLAAAHVRATLHDAVGRLVGRLDVGQQPAGAHRLSWKSDGGSTKLSPGAYFILLDLGKEQARLKAVLR
jgi:hypothetical protein